ncbi:MAG: hypothetical protein VX438_07440, partial [Planctomycetota bacterium]|nr:hypothetical protein [Planctomycetota bacterium]
PLIEGDQTKIFLGPQDYISFSTSQIKKTFRDFDDVFRYRAASTPLTVSRQNELLQWMVAQKNNRFALTHLAELKQLGLKLDYPGWEAILTQRAPAQTLPKKKAPKTAFAEYARKVEAHLVLGCGIVGCHGPGTVLAFSLDATSVQNPLQPRIQNYERTLAIIQQYGKAEFLDYVATKHGSLVRGMYPKATPEYREIATWVNRKPGASSQVNRLKRNQNSAVNPTPLSVPRLTRATPPQTIKPYRIEKASEALPKDRPKDEFDPWIFNQLQRRKNQGEPSKSDQAPSEMAIPKRLIDPDLIRSKN